MSETRAAVLRELRSPLSVEELQLPTVLEYGQVHVNVFAAGICGAQLREVSGAKGEDKYLPHLLGHEGAGVVLACGSGVSTVSNGDYVVMHWRRGSGIEGQPVKYRCKDGSFVGAGPVTTFGEKMIVSENRVTTVDKAVPFDIAALMGCAVTTGFGLVNNEAQLKIGQSIAVAGCGGVGLCVVLAASLAGAYPIYAVDIRSGKKKLAAAMGANGAYGEMRTIPQQVDVFVDCTGNPDVINAGLNSTKPGGKLILVGQPDWGKVLTLTDFGRHYCGKTVMDSQGGLADPAVDIPRYVSMYLAGKLSLLDKLITHRFELGQVNQALRIVRTDKGVGRCVLRMR